MGTLFKFFFIMYSRFLLICMEQFQFRSMLRVSNFVGRGLVPLGRTTLNRIIHPSARCILNEQIKVLACASQIRCIHQSPRHEDEKTRWSMIMSDEQKKTKKEKIDKMKEEEIPQGLVAKVKYYLKRYWYIAVPAHMVCCSAYFAGFYLLVYSGVDVVSLLHFLHMPNGLVEKVASTPPSAGAFVVAFILYKIAMPLRYLTTLGIIQLTFRILQRMGKLRTAREVEYSARLEYEKGLKKYGRRLYRHRNKGVREISKKNIELEEHARAVKAAGAGQIPTVKEKPTVTKTPPTEKKDSN